MRKSYALNEYSLIRRERTWIGYMVENVSLIDRLIVNVIISHNPASCVIFNCERMTSIEYRFLHESLITE